jgi:hypothetical protein
MVILSILVCNANMVIIGPFIERMEGASHTTCNDYGKDVVELFCHFPLLDPMMAGCLLFL